MLEARPGRAPHPVQQRFLQPSEAHRADHAVPGLVALTYHDKVVGRRSFPYTLPDLLYAHREDVGIGPRRLIPQGIECGRR